ncbi:protease complex subunit PrcB family protein [Clostridium autoethanogenum]|uniref:Protease complex subunit PrcB family protein n=1 Tax=Clostridium autoethanogenum DSM 10061 TaxID=1341692 RepID=A0ABN4BH74_9CLOT|nr:protease complex subunit PrcB family protein [Clostridium autoethanogenum]AGY75210.1 protease complex subunit PrcB family protein [Clostridium autoethanogenum DSM 10061]ALU35380.1 PrcB C-terminal domain-containing protein [Clostridium autoethanogenum DSM 10061]OVY49541.1 hypothetical protein WX72_03466 [Clostridium autoethanogenum]
MFKKLFIPMCFALAVGAVYMPASVKAQGTVKMQSSVSNISKDKLIIKNGPNIMCNKIDFQTISYDNAPKALTNGIDSCKSSEGFLYYLDSSTNYLYVAVMRGQKPTGGYDIKVDAVEDVEGRGNIIVKETDPDKGAIVPQVVTYPYTIIKVKLPDFSISVKNSSGKVYDYLGAGESNIIGASWVIGNLENIYTDKDYIFIKVKYENGDTELFYVKNNDEGKNQIKNLKVNSTVSVRYALGTPEKYNGEAAFPLIDVKMPVDKSIFTDKGWEDLNSKDCLNILRDKQWTIKFKDQLNDENVNSSNIYVVDSSGNVIPTALSLQDDKKSVKVTPYKPYKLGQKYYLFIVSKLNNNTSSLKGYRMGFQISDSIHMN